MRFDIFRTRTDAHVRRAQEYLQQANMARLEHQTAAEHHAALAKMYAQRINWLERELLEAANGGMQPLRGVPAAPKQIEAVKRGPESILALARSQRTASEGAA
jgi:hypothetical protein